ncbi:hypothetical protein [Streptomyces sp. NPDC053367]|uniref:hypothetical protein n=1 Tax=Streptomyces sp. NPDC053367 TaxID=3365700 RepID=UPI0037D6023C
MLSHTTVPAQLQTPPPGDLVVGSNLRALRRDRDKTAIHITKHLRLNLAAVSQMERAASALAPSRVRDMLRLYGLRDFEAAARGERGRGLWHIVRLGARVMRFVPHKEDGKTVRAVLRPA